MEKIISLNEGNVYYNRYVDTLVRNGQLTDRDLDYLRQRSRTHLNIILSELLNRKIKIKAKIARIQVVIKYLKENYRINDEEIDCIPVRYNQKIDEIYELPSITQNEIVQLTSFIPVNIIFAAMESDFVRFESDLNLLEDLICEFRTITDIGVEKYEENKNNVSLNIQLTKAIIAFALLLILKNVEDCENKSLESPNNHQDTAEINH